MNAVSAPPHADPGELLTAWVQAFNARDLDRICSLYADDAVLWGTFSPHLIDSPAGVRAYFVRAFEPALQASAELQAFRLQPLGPVVVASGGYGLWAALGGQRRRLPARFTMVLRAAGGTWQIATHHSSQVPAPPAD